MSLREVRFFRKFSQYDVALKTGLPQSKISLIENGYTAVKEEEKRKIAKALGCKVLEVFPDETAN